MNKTVVNFAPTGMLPTKNQTPYVPITVEEIICETVSAAEIGISMVHLHVRNEITGEPDYKKETYARIISGIRDKVPDMIICVSTSGRTKNEFESRSEVLTLKGDLKPDMGSLTLSSLNFNNQASINDPTMILQLLDFMNQNKIKPELEAFDVGMLNYAVYLIKKGMLKPPYYFNLILGNIACAQANLLHIGAMVNSLPQDSVFSLGGVGNVQLMVNSLAISMGYGVRIGLEDNIWFDKERTRLATNADLLHRVHHIIDSNGSSVMSSSELRNILGLCDGISDYGTKE